jgi:hypothetical protein
MIRIQLTLDWGDLYIQIRIPNYVENLCPYMS